MRSWRRRRRPKQVKTKMRMRKKMTKRLKVKLRRSVEGPVGEWRKRSAEVLVKFPGTGATRSARSRSGCRSGFFGRGANGTSAARTLAPAS